MTQPTDSAAACAQLLEAVARAVRSGSSFSSALHQAIGDTDDRCSESGTVDIRLVDALRRHRRGVRLTTCLADARAGCTDDAVRLTLTVLFVASGHGGPSAEAIDRAAATLRDRAALTADARVHAAPARLSATVLALSPIAFSGAAAVLDQRVRSVLVASPVGWLCIAAGVALAGAGRRWMTHLVSTSS